MKTNLLGAALIAASVLAAPGYSLAQNNTTTDTAPAVTTDTRDVRDHRGFDWGWLGLLGLIGLAGLARRERPTVRSNATTAGTTTGTRL